MVKMGLLKLFACILFVFSIVESKVYFKETFGDADWEKRWISSTKKGSDAGKFVLSAGKFYNDPELDKGIQTSQDAKFYGISAKFDEAFSNKDKDLVIQFSVKHEQTIDCGGGYVKVFASDLDQAGMHGDSPYNIMFGPDICGPGTKKVHVIFNYKGKNLLTKKDIRCKDDEMTHLYTLIVKPDNTYEVRIDNEKVESGELEQDWEFLPEKKIKDPEAKKPDDWVDEAKIPDPTDKKPDDYDKPQHIPDPDAKKPEDWDDEIDGEWEPPMIDNPEYKGEWKPKMIDNPAYKGEWVHPEIDNPDYAPDSELYKYDDFGAIGFDLWQVKSGTIFDNIIITDSVTEAEDFAKETFDKTKEGEKKMKDEQDEKERKEREEEEKKKKEEDDSKKDDGEEEEEEEEEEVRS
ncbi:calreticulin-like [Dendronephthya gigantea]|uniref:calreticulin-like n=1 Tax=Dendronephthya gigantea TaxID=151771 RepID=UPI00106BC915|nr:calreticulin-like [Dendronephthya gigantea]